MKKGQGVALIGQPEIACGKPGAHPCHHYAFNKEAENTFPVHASSLELEVDEFLRLLRDAEEGYGEHEQERGPQLHCPGRELFQQGLAVQAEQGYEEDSHGKASEGRLALQRRILGSFYF